MKKKQLGKLTMAAAMLALAGTGATAGVMAVPSVCCAAEDYGTKLEVAGVGDFYYTEDTSGITLTKYSGSASDIDLGKILTEAGVVTESKKLVSIVKGAFKANKTLTTITIPVTVTSIGGDQYGGAFSSASNLTTVIFEEGSQLTSIGGSAFSGCKSLRNFNFMELQHLESIGQGAFCSTALSSLTIPKSCNYIGGEADLTNGAFEDSSIQKIAFEARDTAITLADQAFYGMKNLTEIEFPALVNVDDEGKSCIPTRLLYGCSSLTKVTLPENCVSIGTKAFYECSSLPSMVLPDGCKTIGEEAFYGCVALSDITLSKNLETIGSRAFSGSSRYNSSNDRACGLLDLTIPSQVTDIGEKAFYNCSSLETVWFQGNPTIRDNAFPTHSSAKNMVFLCEPGSQAENVAKSVSYSVPYQRPVDSLEVVTAPTQKEYYYNDGLNWQDGLVLKAVWTSETEKVKDGEGNDTDEKKPTLLTMSPAQDSGMMDATTVFANAVVSGYDAKTVGNQEVVISYGGETAKFPVSVKYCMDSNEQVSNVSLAVSAQTYSSAEQKPELTVKNKVTGVALTAGTDYDVAYTNNINAGTATVTITGKGNYKGTISKTFAINPCDLSSEGITASVPDQTYTGKAIKPAASAVILKNGETALVAEEDFDLADSNAYGNKNTNASKNSAYMTVVGTGNYKGSLKIPFVIKPKPMSEITLSEIPFNQEELQVRREDQEHDQDRLYLREAEKGQDLLCACPRV